MERRQRAAFSAPDRATVAGRVSPSGGRGWPLVPRLAAAGPPLGDGLLLSQENGRAALRQIGPAGVLQDVALSVLNGSRLLNVRLADSTGRRQLHFLRPRAAPPVGRRAAGAAGPLQPQLGRRAAAAGAASRRRARPLRHRERRGRAPAAQGAADGGTCCGDAGPLAARAAAGVGATSDRRWLDGRRAPPAAGDRSRAGRHAERRAPAVCVPGAG